MVAPNSRRPENDDSLTGTFKEILRKQLQKTDDMLPAVVVSHNRQRNRVRVRPLITMVDTLGNIINREEVASIPVFVFGGGNFFINFNISPGDIGWIKANDRDISNFLNSYRTARPNTKRMHNFSDSVFIPDVMTNYTIASEDSAAMVIQNRDGSVKIALDESQIRVVNNNVRFEINGENVRGVAPGGFDLNGATIDGQGAITSPVSVTAPIVTGTTSVSSPSVTGSDTVTSAAITATTSIEAPSIVADGKELTNHDHPAGTPPGNTGVNN